MDKLKFEWGDTKNKVNIQRHGVSFEDAQTVFYDEYAIQFFDPDHSETEDRFLLLGTSFILKTLVVCHCFSQEETTVRIISARKANRSEAQVYWSKRK